MHNSNMIYKNVSVDAGICKFFGCFFDINLKSVRIILNKLSKCIVIVSLKLYNK